MKRKNIPGLTEIPAPVRPTYDPYKQDREVIKQSPKKSFLMWSRPFEGREDRKRTMRMMESTAKAMSYYLPAWAGFRLARRTDDQRMVCEVYASYFGEDRP